jgi:putrescine oxidase
MKPLTENKVIIIGAGLSGLAAADHLLTKDRTLEVVVLEAMDRVGGKTYTKEIRGTNFDFGAEFIGQSQKHAIDLAIRSKQ